MQLNAEDRAHPMAQHESGSGDAGHDDPKPAPSTRPGQRRTRLAVPALLLVLLLTLLSIKLMTLPLNSILELRYCLDYYKARDPTRIPPNGSIPESECKVEQVQQRLGWTMGAFDTTMQACDLAIATPLGYSADKIGRRLVLALNCVSTAVLLLWITFVGSIRSIPPMAILVGPLLTLFGGGNNVFKSASVALMSDLAETDTQRTSHISYFLSMDYISMLAGPMLAAVIMPHGLLLPLWTGITLIAIAIPLLGFVPATNKGLAASPSQRSNSNDHEQQALLHNDEITTDAALSTTQSLSKRSPIHGFFTEYINLLKASSNFRLLLLAKFFASFASSSSSLLALYITLRTGWTLG